MVKVSLASIEDEKNKLLTQSHAIWAKTQKDTIMHEMKYIQ